MNNSVDHILEELPNYKAAADAVRETVLANLVMIGEVPAPTFGEEQRSDLIQQRFSEAGLQEVSSDEMGNAVGVINGCSRDEHILLVAHTDTVFSDEDDHTITVHTDRVEGPGVGDNSLGVAALTTLPQLIEELGLTCEANIILMATSRSLGRGNLEGLRFFLENSALRIKAGICVEGVQWGRLSIASLGMLRGEIICRVPEEYDWSRFGTGGAIHTLNEIINRILEIRLPRKPRNTIVLGSIHGGTSYNTAAASARLRFEIRGESDALVNDAGQQVEDIVAETISRSGAGIELDIFARRKSGGIPTSHPLARAATAILKRLGIQPRLAPSMSELSALIDHGIPAVTVGLTSGEHLNELNETIMLDPLASGLAQLIGMVKAIDESICDEDE